MKLGFDKASNSAAVIAGELRKFADALEAAEKKFGEPKPRLIYTALVEVELWRPLKEMTKRAAAKRQDPTTPNA